MGHIALPLPASLRSAGGRVHPVWHAKRDHRNFFSQFSIAHQIGSSSFQPNLANNSSSIGRALPETENRKWMRLSRRPGWRHKLGTFRQKSKITILWRHYLGQFQPYPVHIWQPVRGCNPLPPPTSLRSAGGLVHPVGLHHQVSGKELRCRCQ